MKESLFYKVIRPIITGFTRFFLRPKYYGLEYINKEGRIILGGTHTNILDCLVLISSTKRCIHFLAKDELFHGIKKIIFANLGLIPVNRKIKDKEALDMAIKYLEDDKVIGIFPEGTTEKGRGLLPFKIGAVKMASVTGSKIVPFVIKGKYKLFSKDLRIVFGKLIMVESNDLDSENERFRNEIIRMLSI